MSAARVLVLEDDAHFGASVLRMLARFGYEASLVDDIDACLELLVRQTPDLLLTDLNLSGGTGHDVLRTVRRHHAGLPVVAMSGQGDVGDVVHLFRSGVSDYLVKPFRPEELRRALAVALRGESSLPPPPAAPSARRPSLPRLLDRLTPERVPPPPSAASELLGLGGAALASAARLVEAVQRDPALAAGVLRLANRCDVLGARPARSLQEACVRLGNGRIVGLAHQLLVQGLLPVRAGGLELQARTAWSHTLAAAELARDAGLACDAVDPDDAFLATLLHNLGELVLLSASVELVREGFGAPAVITALTRQAPEDHEAAGRLAARVWALPRPLAAIAAQHHQSPGRIRAPLRAAVVFGAEAATARGQRYFGNAAVSTEQAARNAHVVGATLGLSPDLIDGWLTAP